MTDFAGLVQAFAKAVESNDGPGLAALFTADGTYVDYFFGPYAGPGPIADMLAHFHQDARAYQWQFSDPVCDGATGYARYVFSYVSTMPQSEGRAVVFEGMSCFKLRDGKIAHYSEVFDRGMALAQLDFAAERMKKSLAKFATRQNTAAQPAAHAARVRGLGASVLG